LLKLALTPIKTKTRKIKRNSSTFSYLILNFGVTFIAISRENEIKKAK
jgi:hypothetical protein